MPKRFRDPGEFCWINMITAKPAEAQQFYSKLLGWTFEEMPGMGHLILVDGARIGGMFDLDSPQNPPGTKAVLGVMVKVTDADAMATRVNELGGKALPPMSIGANGRMVVAHDPSGANIDLWEPGKQGGSDCDGATQGAFSWFELYSKDTKRDKQFYHDLFGWTHQDFPMPAFAYTTFLLRDVSVAGMMGVEFASPGVKPHWATYFTVTDIEKTVAQAPTLGAKVFLPITPAPGVGRFAGIASPQGIHFMAMQYERA